MPNNNHIVNFLDNYLEVQHDPDYAVLITGCWGSGKTHFIKQYLGGKDWKTIDNWLTGCEKYRVVYVSLFGAKSREELNQRVIERVAPYLKKLSVLPQAVSLIGSFLHPTAGSPFLRSKCPLSFPKNGAERGLLCPEKIPTQPSEILFLNA